MNFQELAGEAQQTTQQGLETTKQAAEGLVSNPVATRKGAASNGMEAVGQTTQQSIEDTKQTVTNPGDFLDDAEKTLKHGLESTTGTVSHVFQEAEDAVKHGFESISNVMTGLFGGGKTEEEPKT